MAGKKKSSALENRVTALEGHVRDLENGAEALVERMKAANLVERMKKLETITGQ